MRLLKAFKFLHARLQLPLHIGHLRCCLVAKPAQLAFYCLVFVAQLAKLCLKPPVVVCFLHARLVLVLILLLQFLLFLGPSLASCLQSVNLLVKSCFVPILLFLVVLYIQLKLLFFLFQLKALRHLPLDLLAQLVRPKERFKGWRAKRSCLFKFGKRVFIKIEAVGKNIFLDDV